MIKEAFQRVMAREPYKSYPDDYMYRGSLIGNLRSAVLGLLAVYVSRYLDLWGQLIWIVQGKELLITEGGMQFHARVGFVMGILLILGSIFVCFNLYRQHRQLGGSLPLPSCPSKEAYDAEIALRSKEQSEERARHGFPEHDALPSSTPDQRLKNFLWRFPLLHDFLWGWPFLLGLSLIFFGNTLDGSPNPGLSGVFTLPGLDFFVLTKTPASAMNGLFIGAVAYIINHAISKMHGLPLRIKLLINLLVGVFACWAWYLLTLKMGAPI